MTICPAGPPTGHMVIAARSRSLAGPWEDCPANPLVRTTSAAQKWWSRGHATLVEGPGRDWWAVYHGYENGFWTLGRQTLLDPIEWTSDGWFRFKGGDLSRPIAKPKGARGGPHGQPLSDDFRSDRMGLQWSFYNPGPRETDRLTRSDGVMTLKAKGSSPADASPLTFIAGDPAYRVEVEIEVDDGAQAGLLLFYNRRLYCGLGFNRNRLVMHRQGLDRPAARLTPGQRRLWIRATNDHHIVTFHTSADGRSWTKYEVQMEVSGYHHNTAYDFLSLRPGLYAAGTGAARFRDLKFRALNTQGGEHGA
jgi:xylan 1,4-beta-xylosidase